MGSLFIFFIFSLVLFASGLHVHARPDPRSPPMAKSNAASCHTPAKAIADDSAKGRPFVRDFEPVPNLSVYGDDTKLTKERFYAEGKPFVRDFEPIPNLSVYGDDAKLTKEKSGRKGKLFVRDFEPTPTVTAYDNNAELTEERYSTKENQFLRDFEPMPNASVFSDDTQLMEQKPFQTDIEHASLKEKTIIGDFQA